MLDENGVYITGGWFRKYIPLKKLKELLKNLDDSLLIYPSSAGDLTIARAEDHLIIGIISISEETLYGEESL